MKRRTLGKAFKAATHETVTLLSGEIAGGALLAKAHHLIRCFDRYLNSMRER